MAGLQEDVSCYNIAAPPQYFLLKQRRRQERERPDIPYKNIDTY